jgi:hypothetical protein
MLASQPLRFLPLIRAQASVLARHCTAPAMAAPAPGSISAKLPPPMNDPVA